MKHPRRFAPTADRFDPEPVSTLNRNHCPVLPDYAHRMDYGATFLLSTTKQVF